MNWNDAAEDFLNQLLAETPRPVREQTEARLRSTAEMIAETMVTAVWVLRP